MYCRDVHPTDLGHQTSPATIRHSNQKFLAQDRGVGQKADTINVKKYTKMIWGWLALPKKVAAKLTLCKNCVNCKIQTEGNLIKQDWPVSPLLPNIIKL